MFNGTVCNLAGAFVLDMSLNIYRNRQWFWYREINERTTIRLLVFHMYPSFNSFKIVTAIYLQSSTVSTYQTMSAFMDANPSAMMDTVWEGVERVRSSKGRYAFMLESVYNDYLSNRRPCDTMKVGPNLNNKGYGIATPRSSPWRWV